MHLARVCGLMSWWVNFLEYGLWVLARYDLDSDAPMILEVDAPNFPTNVRKRRLNKMSKIHLHLHFEVSPS